MAGHSKWANIKHRKGAQDAKRGKIFTKIIREITVAARAGGEDLDSNPRLRTAVLKARAANMPNDNIERAIKKGTGNLDGVTYEEVRYEGFGPGGVAIMVDCLSDNKNRTTPEIRTIFNKNGGNLGSTGSVGHMFDRKGVLVIPEGQTSEDEVMEFLMEYDIEDIAAEEDTVIVKTAPEAFSDVSEALLSKGYNLSVNEITYEPQTTVELDEKKAEQCLRLIGLLEDHDDSQDVFSNYDISDEIMEKLS